MPTIISIFREAMWPPYGRIKVYDPDATMKEISRLNDLWVEERKREELERRRNGGS